MFQRHRCCAFDSPGLPNDSAGYPGLVDIVRGTTPSVLRFLCVIRHKSPRYNHAFTEKTQHLRRWISLRTFTWGRLVPRQPRAIKGTTRTELHGEVIMMLISLIMKCKMIWGISSCKIRQIIWSFDAFCRPVCLKSFYLWCVTTLSLEMPWFITWYRLHLCSYYLGEKRACDG